MERNTKRWGLKGVDSQSAGKRVNDGECKRHLETQQVNKGDSNYSCD